MADLPVWLCLLCTLAAVIFLVSVINGLAHNRIVNDRHWWERTSRIVIACTASQVVLVLSMQHYRVDKLREMLATQAHIPIEAIQVSDEDEEHTQYVLETPNGTKVSWSGPDGMRSGTGGTELSGLGGGIVGNFR